jgi:phosphate transport system permease protein
MEKNITPINQLSWKDRLKSYKKHPGSFILLLLVGASAVITVTVLVYLVGYILIHGVPYLRPSLFALTYNSDNVSMMPAIINTITMVLLALLFSVPFGIGAAIYLVEYAKKGNKLVELVRITAETLTGIPSIIYGLFGMLFFVTALHWGYSMLAGAATLAIMVLPVIMRTTEEALLCVPDMYREGSFGLGAGKLRTIFPETVKKIVHHIITVDDPACQFEIFVDKSIHALDDHIGCLFCHLFDHFHINGAFFIIGICH